jgi:hypothetical protein
MTLEKVAESGRKWQVLKGGLRCRFAHDPQPGTRFPPRGLGEGSLTTRRTQVRTIDPYRAVGAVAPICRDISPPRPKGAERAQRAQREQARCACTLCALWCTLWQVAMLGCTEFWTAISSTGAAEYRGGQLQGETDQSPRADPECYPEIGEISDRAVQTSGSAPVIAIRA